ncbi:MAG: TraB/GumN family protein [Chitinophagaceae bacterium]|nr:TraB/GumN family protein [Chitinophagaceae bacterium]
MAKKKPSYLIGTMHVSSKLAFHLPDSFYIAIKNVQVVALETNPETWQEDMDKYDLNSFSGNRYAGYMNRMLEIPSDYLTINTLKFYKYYSKIERALFSNPSVINNLLYRTYGEQSSDFEEDTYLDMYIFQCGKKRGKKVAGVEDYGESMRLMAEAYKDAAKDKNRKERSYGDVAEDYSPAKLQDAYRSGDLDMLDSINRFNSVSAAFDEKFLYKRNEIQTNSIDSIIKTGVSLFVGVGAAHLPGTRGVIEMLRQKGYKVRPVKMGERDSKEKDIVDKIRVPVTFKTEVSEDGFFKVDIPGKFYKSGDDPYTDQRQYADMANGSYYMVTRILSNAWMWNHDEDKVYKAIDSLLYENVPGKILSKSTIVKNGYKGFDIVNRTRRGDVQRYHIFITPFEILFFKMSGTADYVKLGEEANKFFGSIQLKEYKNWTNGWKKFSPSHGGFSVAVPHEPYIGNDGSWIFDAADKQNGLQYRVVRTDIHNYSFIEEDTFDLALMDESFMASEFIDSQLMRKQTTYKGYPALDAKYSDKDGHIFMTRFIIKGPHYYTLVAHGKQEVASMGNFLNSFDFQPVIYGATSERRDTALYYTVSSPVFPENKKIKLDMPEMSIYGGYDDDEEEDDGLLSMLDMKSKIVKNDTTGEKILVAYYKWPRYFYTKDSSLLDFESNSFSGKDSTLIIKVDKRKSLSNGTKIREMIVTDTGSSRILFTKQYYKDGVLHILATLSDTLSVPGNFVKNFYSTFVPADTLKGPDPFSKKSKLFFEDFASADSVIRKKAVKGIAMIYLDSTDLGDLMQAINNVNWKEKKYLNLKGSLIAKLGDIKTNAAADYLKKIYYEAQDTIQFQYIALENLLQHRTVYAYSLFRQIINDEIPVLEFEKNSYEGNWVGSTVDYWQKDSDYDNNKFLDELSDSLLLTKAILPDLLPLLNLDEYKSSIMELLGKMVDSSIVSAKDYEHYYSKFLIEAKQELRKQAIAEKKKAIEKAEESKTEKKQPSYPDYGTNKDEGNEDLSLYTRLLLPFAEKNTIVEALIQQIVKTEDKELKYKTLFQLLAKKRAVPDSLFTFFASLDEYRYNLYSDLKERKKLDKFPDKYRNHTDLGKSSLLASKSYGMPDTLIYIDRLPTTYKEKSGYLYFYKYKEKKDDIIWKLAVLGLVPEDSREIEFDDINVVKNRSKAFSQMDLVSLTNKYDFTEFTDTKIDEERSIAEQLRKYQKRMLYSRRKSAARFYEENEDYDGYGQYNLRY